MEIEMIWRNMTNKIYGAIISLMSETLYATSNQIHY